MATGVATHAFNPNTCESEADEPLCLRLVLFLEWDPVSEKKNQYHFFIETKNPNIQMEPHIRQNFFAPK